MKILVGYASAHGSTAEVAQYIGDTLEERQFNVTVANVTDIQSVDQYDAFILGSAIHAGMWLKELSQFLTQFGGSIKGKPFYLFVTCIRVLEPDGYQFVIDNYVHHHVIDPLGVREVQPFAGKLDLNQVDWDERWTLAARYDGSVMPGSYNHDFRNWDVIKAWAMRVADALLPG